MKCWKSWVVTLGVFSGLAALAAEQTPPNILFVIFDDLNDCVEGFDGNPDALTPNLSRLMKDGVTFMNAQCTAPLCSPSRPSMLTGLYPHTARYFGDADKDAPDGLIWYDSPVYKRAKTWVQFFKENHYGVFGTGKIYHQRSEKWSDFEDQNGVRSYGQKQTFAPYPTDGGRHPKFPQALKTTCYPQQSWRGKEGFFTPLDCPPIYDAVPSDAIGPAGWTANGVPLRYRTDEDRDLVPDEISAGYAVDLLSRRHEKPFFINVGFHRPHLPLTAPRRNFDRFPLDKIQLAKIKENDLDDCARMLVCDPDCPQFHHGGFDKYDSVVVEHDKLAEFTQAYLACVNFADEQLGQVLDALAASPYADNTLVVVTGDNGFHLGEKHWLFKFTAWEESTHVPLVIAGPGLAKGRRVTHPVSLVDLYPTLLDLSDLPMNPHGPGLPLDGHSLRSFLEPSGDGKWAGPDVALTVLASRNPKFNKTPVANRGVVNRQIYTVRSEQYRYTLCPDGEEELYDHQSDPQEWTNLAGNPEYAPLKKELRSKMEALVGEPLAK